MLLFLCSEAEALPTLRREGLALDATCLYETLEAAEAECRDAVLVIDRVRASAVVVEGLESGHLPPEVFLNLDPYQPPKPVTAAGGYVVRPGAGEPEVLLIFRRGKWDLPKGKLDRGESIEDCALREVREELGIKTVHLRAPLGTTLHGYAEKGVYRVKTTHWFLMETTAQDFSPEQEEDIEAVAWVPWSAASAQVGYASLRQHMEAVAAEVREALEAA